MSKKKKSGRNLEIHTLTSFTIQMQQIMKNKTNHRKKITSMLTMTILVSSILLLSSSSTTGIMNTNSFLDVYAQGSTVGQNTTMVANTTIVPMNKTQNHENTSIPVTFH